MDAVGISPAIGPAAPSHWVRWHEAYEDPGSALSVRLRLVQAGVRAVLDGSPPGPIKIVSLCAGQGRDVIDVVAAHPRRADVDALLVELDPALAAFARTRAAGPAAANADAGTTTAGPTTTTTGPAAATASTTAAGASEGGRIRVLEADASVARHFADAVPADLVLVCGVFGNISDDDIATTVAALPSFCSPGASVVWTRHRRPPDKTPAIRALFTGAGFVEEAFDAPEGLVLAVGRHRLERPPSAFDPGLRLFTFVGDGGHPA